MKYIFLIDSKIEINKLNNKKGAQMSGWEIIAVAAVIYWIVTK